MTARLTRIQVGTIALTALAAAAAQAFGWGRPIGIVCGGGAAVLDFMLIRRLAYEALGRRVSAPQLVSLAVAKSLALLLIPAGALLLPETLIDGPSFALGVTALPVAILIDALTPLAAAKALDDPSVVTS